MPNLESVEIILFDLGGVLIDIHYQATAIEMNKLGFLDFDSNYSQFEQVNLFNLFETGKISEQRFINDLKPFMRESVTPNQIVYAWNAMIGSFPIEKINLLERLSLKRVAMLSNTNAIHWKKVMREWDKVSNRSMENYFERIFLSHELGLRKPDLITFQTVCKELKVEPSKVMFIDDSPQHIEGALHAGFQTHFYTNPHSFYELFS